ncbi:MAG: hypothetical protein RSA92_07140 [Bacteroidaceae bacterium]
MGDGSGGENGCISACGVCGDVLHGGADLRGSVRCDCRSSGYCCNFYNRGVCGEKMNEKNELEFEVKYLKYLVKRLKTLSSSIKKAVDKETEARQRRVEQLCEYKDVDEARDAYGYGYISREEYDEIYDVLKKNAAFIELNTYKKAALDTLNEFIRKKESDIRSFEWEMKSPEERDEINKSNEAFKAKFRRMKNGSL